jgi:hypothetical protein
MRTRLFFRFLLVFVMAFGADGLAQDKPSDKPKVPDSGHLQRKAARKKWKEERKQKKAERKAVKNYQKKLQTKKTQRRMKRDKRKSDRVNAHKPEFFLKRWFRKKHN